MKPIRLTVVTFLAWATIALAALCMLTAAWWLLYPYEPLTVHSAKILNGDKEVRQGDTLFMVLEITKRNPVPGVGVRSFVDGLIYTMPPQTGNLPVGTNTVIREVPVPEALPPGRYRLHTEVRFEMNPIRTITVGYNSESFTVTPK